MRGVVVVAGALLFALASSGCFVPADDPETQGADVGGAVASSTASGSTAGSTSKSGTATSATSTTGSAAASNAAPTASLVATPLNGTAPLEVTFEVNGTDADGENLTWILSFEGTTIANGTSLPAEATHTFTEVGNHTVSLRVSDASANATTNVTVAVEAAAAPAPTGPNICEAPSETSIGGQMYIDRVSWIFRESNGLPGLQYTAEPSLIGEVDDAGTGCENGDTLLF
ncbi:MAG: PKD domain-containing protein [Candidatus Thermoplasmatota archaeon]